MAIMLKEITGHKDLKRFVLFPFTLYRGNANWVPPMIRGELGELSPDKNPAFAHCEVKCLLAFNGKEVVGRIAGIINHKYNELWEKRVVRFYWFDFIDDPRVSGALLNEVEQWALEKGIEEIIGPMGFTNFERQGMLVEGFDQLPTISSTYNYEYYPTHMEYHGYAKESDYVEFIITVPDQSPEKSQTIAEAVARRYKLQVLRARSKKELMTYSEQVFRVINAAYGPIHGFVPLDEQQVQHTLKRFNSVITLDFTTAVLDENDQMVGFHIAMPSLSRAMQKARGRLFPFGFYHIAKAIRKPQKIDILLFGVIPEYQYKGVNAFLMHELTMACLNRGIPYAESNGMLEENFKMLNFQRYFEAVQHKRRRLFYKTVVG